MSEPADPKFDVTVWHWTVWTAGQVVIVILSLTVDEKLAWCAAAWSGGILAGYLVTLFMVRDAMRRR